MKKFIYLLVISFTISSMLFSCSDDENEKQTKSADNLKAAITGETEAMTKYAVFSEKAAEEGLNNISNMFKATSKAEKIHIDNHQRVLKAMNVTFTPTTPSITPKTTAENLISGIDGETYESTEMYPAFVKEAQDETNESAERTFTYALKAEQKHASLYESALTELNKSKTDKEISSVWFVCPRCGDVYFSIDGLDNCRTCGEETGKFEKIG